MYNKKITLPNRYIYPIILSIFSVLINQYYGYVGILPIDSFLIFNSGYDFLNGFYPFKDYWTIKEPFIDFLQSLFFKLFGVSWFVYVLHASLFNLIISLSTYFVLRFFKLSEHLSFLYSFCVAALTYPTAGTPFSDHHTLILCVLAIYLFLAAIKTNKNFFWFLIPVILGLSFLSKQAPTIYVVGLISVFSIFYFVIKKQFNGLLFSVIGLSIFLFIFLLILIFADIKFIDFINQYILFPQSLGASRLEWVFPLEFKRFILRFKIHYLSIFFMFLIIVRSILFKNKKIKMEDYIVLLTLITLCILFIFHQLMTINAIFIYCLIPIFLAFSHIYSDIFYKIKYLKNFFIIFLLISSSYYFITYVHNRTFMDLRNVDLNKAIDAGQINNRLSGIKWITIFYPEKPEQEIKKINFAVEILKNDKEKKMIITDYQFISVFLNQYDYAVTRFWYDFHGYPSSDNKFFEYWKKFVLNKIEENKIRHIYVLKPLHGENNPLENILKKCYKKKVFSETFYRLNVSSCVF